MDATKVCLNCGHEKSIRDFHRQIGTKDGRRNTCKVCRNDVKRADYRAKHQPRTGEQKTCSVCGDTKALTSFYTHPDHTDGRASECKDCKRARELARYESHGGEDRFQKRRARRAEYELSHRVVCLLCEQNQPATRDYFYSSQDGVLDPMCRGCVDALLARMRRGGSSSEWDYVRVHQVRLKIDVFIHYSMGLPRCNCCGETEILFLSIDHVDGGGAAHRKALGVRSSGYQFYRWLRTHDYPNGFQVLCFQCNLGKGYFGICPHKTKIDA